MRDDGIQLSLPALMTFGARPFLLPWWALADCAPEPGVFLAFLPNVPGRAARLVADEWKRRQRSLGGSPPAALPRP